MFDFLPDFSWQTGNSILNPLLEKLANTPQEPQWHGEGNVLNHTKMVCEAITKLESFPTLPSKLQQCLWLAALLHDIGKPATTRQEDGRWVSPGHARVSSEMARQLLWKHLSGSLDKLRLREAVCSYIRYHTMPPHAIFDHNGSWKLRKAATCGELTSYFHIHGLCLLSQADVLGRICSDQAELTEKIRLCEELAAESCCLHKSYPFPSAHTQFAYVSGKNIPPEFELYDDTWGQVILMSGLPGTGKDTWIKAHYSHLPMVSLDDIRKELGILPTAPQAPVVDAAREKAKELLRKKQPFVWNATNLTTQIRSKQVDLFTAYGAATRIVYLETGWEQQLSRNAGRKDAVPQAALCHMTEKLVVPQRWEAPAVEWHVV